MLINIPPETKRKMGQHMANITHPRMIEAIKEGYDHTDPEQIKEFMKRYEKKKGPE